MSFYLLDASVYLLSAHQALIFDYVNVITKFLLCVYF